MPQGTHSNSECAKRVRNGCRWNQLCLQARPASGTVSVSFSGTREKIIKTALWTKPQTGDLCNCFFSRGLPSRCVPPLPRALSTVKPWCWLAGAATADRGTTSKSSRYTSFSTWEKLYQAPWTLKAILVPRAFWRKQVFDFKMVFSAAVKDLYILKIYLNIILSSAVFGGRQEI